MVNMTSLIYLLIYQASLTQRHCTKLPLSDSIPSTYLIFFIEFSAVFGYQDGRRMIYAKGLSPFAWVFASKFRAFGWW